MRDTENPKCSVPLCSDPSLNDSCTREERIAPPPAPQNVVACRDGHISWNNQNIRVAMSPKRIRIGCTEVSIEAARELVQQHGLRFGKPPEEVWEEIQ